MPTTCVHLHVVSNSMFFCLSHISLHLQFLDCQIFVCIILFITMFENVFVDLLWWKNIYAFYIHIYQHYSMPHFTNKIKFLLYAYCMIILCILKWQMTIDLKGFKLYMRIKVLVGVAYVKVLFKSHSMLYTS